MLDANFDFQRINGSYDVCLVGSGPASITVAHELKDSGLRIIILEGGNENYNHDSQKMYAPAFPPHYYEDTTHDRVRMLGGSSTHWENNTSEYLPSDFLKKDWIQYSGWPISYEDVAAHYPLAAEYCSTGQDSYDSEYWHKSLNISDPVAASHYIRTGIKKSPKQPTRFFKKYHQALAQSPNITIVKNANLKDIEYDPVTKNITSMRFCNYELDGFDVFAKRFIMCLGGIENARFLGIFNEKYENQLGNRYDQVGRYFMDHPLLRAAQLYPTQDSLGLLKQRAYRDKRFISGFLEHNDESILKHEIVNVRMPLFKASEYKLSTGIESAHVFAQALQDGQLPDHSFSHLWNILRDADMVLEGVSRKKLGKHLFASSSEQNGFETLIMFEQLPHYDNRIWLGQTRDKFGLKRHRVTWKFHDKDIKLGWKSLEIMAAELASTKVGRLRILQEFEERLQKEKLFVCHHHMGTTRMAENEAEGVVDSNQKVFNTNNLFINGSSVFVTGSHIPPTLTITALSIRLAKHIRSQEA